MSGPTPHATANVRALTVSETSLRIDWTDGLTSTFHHVWLRDNCPQLRHASTNHRVAETSEIPNDVRPRDARISSDGGLAITWEHDGHVSTFDPDWLRDNDYSNGARYAAPRLALWDAASIATSLPECSYPSLVAHGDVRAAFLDGFLAHGLGVLHDVPCVPGTVLDVAALLGEIRTTSWGRVFDVVSREDANSVAYTTLPLVTHTDEGYRDPAPTVQLQHFLIADAEGGASTLVDGFKVAEDLRAEAPQAFELLASTMLDFHFADATAEHHARDSVISLHPDGSIRQIRYSNHSALPFRIAAEMMEPYYAAYRRFGAMRESTRYRFEVALGSGDLYIVDNHRVLHGRTGFRSGRARHLQSCYVERDELVSRLAVLKRASALAPQ